MFYLFFCLFFFPCLLTILGEILSGLQTAVTLSLSLLVFGGNVLDVLMAGKKTPKKQSSPHSLLRFQRELKPKSFVSRWGSKNPIQHVRPRNRLQKKQRGVSQKRPLPVHRHTHCICCDFIIFFKLKNSCVFLFKASCHAEENSYRCRKSSPAGIYCRPVSY